LETKIAIAITHEPLGSFVLDLTILVSETMP
jgi:hypothetical protein